MFCVENGFNPLLKSLKSYTTIIHEVRRRKLIKLLTLILSQLWHLCLIKTDLKKSDFRHKTSDGFQKSPSFRELCLLIFLRHWQYYSIIPFYKSWLSTTSASVIFLTCCCRLTNFKLQISNFKFQISNFKFQNF